MSINSINQIAASSYIAEQAGTNASTEKVAPSTGSKRMVNDVVQISDEAKAAYAASGNSNPRGSLLIAWLNSTTGKADLSNIPTSLPEGAKLNMNGYSSIDEMMDGWAQKLGFGSEDEYRTHLEAKGEYYRVKGEFDSANHKKSQAAYEAFLELSGGLLYGVSYEPGDLSKPIRTTDGRIHPKSDAIRSFLTEHKAEFDQVQQMINRQFMSFENWKANRAA